MKTTLRSDSLQVTRLFSNLELYENQFTHQPGSVLGSTALVAGTTIGAGILALPAVTLPSGIIPSTILLIGIWLYTLVSGLLIAEATLNTMHRLGRPSVGLLAVVENTLGPVGARITGGAYLFFHYGLLVAYVAQGGDILASAVSKAAGVQNVLPAWIGTISFTLIFGSIMYLGRERFIEKLNSAFVAIVLTSFLGLLVFGTTQLKPGSFLFQDWRALSPAVSVMFVALFYHNIIPTVVSQLEGDVRKIRQTLTIGSVIPLVMFLSWNAVILGSVGPDLIQGTIDRSLDPLQILRSGGTGEWLGVLVSIFSEFAIATSFIGFVYGLLDFFKDISAVTLNEPSKRLSIYSLILLPPMSLSLLNPNIFLTALDYTGTFSISVLGGIIPALVSWKQRQEQEHSRSLSQPLVPGGKVTLIVMIGLALAVLLVGSLRV
ncbi:MAG: aromatic amino acid transport family protein [Scytonema sp. PMC 1069.18]|nr:aromatic amino acid transport family protein [Scytonema sp. PMC 1069.18]MEC4887321.1 aromatic amino acid transport family protein [Scytonema sp. PMC 1070.18]